MTLSGSPQFRGTTNVLGGYSVFGDDFTGNSLNVWDYRGSGVTNVRNFQNYNFILPTTMQPGQTLLPVSDAVTLGTGASSTVTGLNALSGQTALKPGDTITLIGGGTSLAGTLANNGQIISGQRGVTLNYDWLLQQTGNGINATVQSVSVNPQAKALSEGRAAGMAFMNQGSDLLSTTGIAAAGSSINRATGQGGSSRYEPVRMWMWTASPS